MRLLVFVAAALCTFGLHAQEFPTKPIRIIAPAAPGSGTDLAARIVGNELGAILKQPVIVENKVGGGGAVGVGYVVKSPADGYTLLLSTDATVAIQKHVMPLHYDPLTDLAAIGEIGNFPLVLMTRGDSSIRSIEDLRQAASAQTKGLSYGMGGQATGGHIVGETVRLSLKANMTAVAYPSAARAVNDLLGGYVEVAVADTTAVSQVNSGKLRAIAVASSERANCLPGVRTLSEQGVSFNLPYSYGLLAPAKTPPAVVATLNSALNKALKSAAVQQGLTQQCVTPTSTNNSAEAFGARVRQHYEQWGTYIRNAGIKIS